MTIDYSPTDEAIDVFLDNPPAQPKRSVVEAVAALNICATPAIFEDLDEATSFIDGSDDSDVMVRSEDPKEYRGASGVLDSVRLRVRLEDARTEGFLWPSLTEMIEVETIGLAKERPLDKLHPAIRSYYQPDELGKASLSFWEYVPGTNIVVARDPVRDGFVHLMDGSSWHARNTSTGDEKWFQGGTGTDFADFDRVADTFARIENSELFDPNVAYIGEFVVGKDGEVYLLQMHHSGNQLVPDTTRIPRDEFTHEWSKATLAIGATSGVETRDVRSVYLANEVTYAYENPSVKDMSIHPSIGSLGRNILGNQADLQFHQLDAARVASEVSSGHVGRSLVFKPRISIAPSYEDRMDYADSSPINQPRFLLDIVSDGYDAYYRTRIRD